MTVFDYIVFAIMGISILTGAWRGFVSEALALTAWLAAFFVARLFAVKVGVFFASILHDPTLRYFAGFMAVFLGVLIAFVLLRVAVSSFLRTIGLGPLDRLLGAFFGLARGLFIAILLVLLAGATALPKQIWWRSAWLSPPLETAAMAMMVIANPWLPPAVAKRIHYR